MITSAKKRILLLALITVTAVVAASCAPDRGSPPERTTPTPTETSAAGKSCSAPQEGYVVRYPEEWHVNDPEGGNPCSWFHPEPFELPARTEATGIAINLSKEDVAFDRAVEGSTEGEHIKEVVSRETTEIAGKQGVRVEIIHSGKALFPADTRETTFLVEWDSGTLIGSATSAADGDYEENSRVLDGIMKSVEEYELEATCSAAALDPELPDQPGLPESVASLRREIANAAVKCDYQRLSELALQGDSRFTYSFGNGEEPGPFWQRQEEEEADASKPMRYLVGMLRRSYGVREVQGQRIYVWPAAFSFDEWESVPQDKKEELKPLYDEVNFQDFARFGGYIGYRVGIDESGDWQYFVAGD